jgi:hypothetical protein
VGCGERDEGPMNMAAAGRVAARELADAGDRLRREFLVVNISDNVTDTKLTPNWWSEPLRNEVRVDRCVG